MERITEAAERMAICLEEAEKTCRYAFGRTVLNLMETKDRLEVFLKVAFKLFDSGSDE